MTLQAVKHAIWAGRQADYQRAIQTAFIAEGRELLPWSWLTTTCDQPMCLEPECMMVWSPVKIAYPSGVCVYCGNVAGTKDHLMPRNRTGEGQRRQVAVVPACGECNNGINDTHAVSISARREVAHAYLRRKNRKLLIVSDRTPEELREFGPTLRTMVEANMRKRAVLRLRLNWPDDPDYDRRAFERSGIFEPAELGLI